MYYIFSSIYENSFKRLEGFNIQFEQKKMFKNKTRYLVIMHNLIKYLIIVFYLVDE